MTNAACRRIREGLGPYLEHEAGPAEALRTARHLSDCTDCSAEVDRTRRLIAALRNLPRPEPRRDIAAGVVGALRRARRAATAPGALKWSALGLLGLLAAIEGLGGNFSLRHGWTALRRLGELMDLSAIADRFVEFLPRLLPAPSSLFEAALAFGASGGGGVESFPRVLPAISAAALAFLLAAAAAAAILRFVAAITVRAASRTSPPRF